MPQMSEAAERAAAKYGTTTPTSPRAGSPKDATSGGTIASATEAQRPAIRPIARVAAAAKESQIVREMAGSGWKKPVQAATFNPTQTLAATTPRI